MPQPPKKPSPTHFLCIPLVTPASRPQLSSALSAFRADVSAPLSAGGFDLPAEAVRPVGTLHLTLGVMSLVSPKQQRGKGRGGDQGGVGDGGSGDGDGEGGGEGENGAEDKLVVAKEVLGKIKLRELWAEVVKEGRNRLAGREGLVGVTLGQGLAGLVGQGGLQKTSKADIAPEEARGDEKPSGVGPEEDESPRITLRGLAAMQTLNQTSVLYAPPVDPFGLLQSFCEKVRGQFQEAELMIDEGRPLLLHATVVNTVYVKGNKRGTGNKRGRGGRGGGGGKKWERLVFDATGIIDRYEDQVWMEDVPVEKVAICQMGAKKVVVDGEEDEAYEVTAEVEI
ncbi:hypothetical protein B0J18DRAFT_432297 [Chaetomium sp. MPI-SDFR-AT-0129]|nr:hypothetical protein B0J18DRAFT_432297 [Chaetomium sp. MPI-SDFR-AT-0129]